MPEKRVQKPAKTKNFMDFLGDKERYWINKWLETNPNATTIAIPRKAWRIAINQMRTHFQDVTLTGDRVQVHGKTILIVPRASL